MERLKTVMEILDKMNFFQGQRAGRELWNDKPFEVQEEDLKNFKRDINIIGNYIFKIEKELKQYRDAEEQGLLLRLPCKVGDVLWCIDNKKVESFVVKEFRICAYKIYRIEIYFENASGFGLCLFNGTLDEGWYRTKKEAEQALAEMEKEKQRCEKESLNSH